MTYSLDFEVASGLRKANPLEDQWRRFGETMGRALGNRPSPDFSLDRKINLDPNADVAQTGTQQKDTTTFGMTLAELLGPEVDELIQASKLPRD